MNTDDERRCPVSVKYGQGRVIRCEQASGHEGVHWSDEAGVVWTWNDAQVFAGGAA